MSHRAEFNRTMDLYTGPTTAFPNVLLGSGPCRLVPQRVISRLVVPFIEADAYVTMDYLEPAGPLVTSADGIYTVDYGKADRVTIADTPIELYSIAYLERFVHDDPYWRLTLASIPFPPPPTDPIPWDLCEFGIPRELLVSATNGWVCEPSLVPLSYGTLPYSLGDGWYSSWVCGDHTVELIMILTDPSAEPYWVAYCDGIEMTGAFPWNFSDWGCDPFYLSYDTFFPVYSDDDCWASSGFSYSIGVQATP